MRDNLILGIILKLKRLFTIGLFILICLLVPLANVTASTWIFYDAIDDVTPVVSGVLQSSGDFQDEIDIISIELQLSDVVITFQDVPQDDSDHQYFLNIFWTNTPVANRTDGYFGMGENTVWTYLHNSTGYIVVDNEEEEEIGCFFNVLIKSNFLLIINSV
ncbi:MAG: hypothetical protein ACTSXA_13940 [Candidatus Heimdallarchaeota archaeon]